MTHNIEIVGDVLVDWFLWTNPSDQKNESINWKRYQSICMRYKFGGSLLVCDLMEKNRIKAIDDFTEALKKVNEIEPKISETIKNLEKVKESSKSSSEYPNIHPESLDNIQNYLGDIEKIMSGVKENLNITSENSKKIQESLSNIEKILGRSQEIRNENSENHNMMRESSSNAQTIPSEVIEEVDNAQKDMTSESSMYIQENLKIGEKLSQMQNELDTIKKDWNTVMKNLEGVLENLNSESIISQNSAHLNINDPNEILHLNTKLGLYPEWGSNSELKIYRVESDFGATTPPTNSNPVPLAIAKDKDTNEPVDFIIIYDAGNGFRYDRTTWPEALTDYSKLKNKPVVIYSMLPPLFTGELWEHTIKNISENLILILNVEDLRALGANISRSISWERTALDLIWEINRNEKLKSIKKLKNVIIRFKIEGALYYTSTGENSRSKLYFDPRALEGGFWDYKKYGKMKGSSIVFISSLSSELIHNTYIKGRINDETLERSIKVSIFKSREYLKKGHGNKDEGINFYAYFYDKSSQKNNEAEDESSQKNNEAEDIKCTLLPQFYDKNIEPDPTFWSILKERTKTKKPNLVEVAMNIVHNGWSAIEDFPAGFFGKLITVDRAEIESLGSLKNIMQGYINSRMNTDPEKNPRPLSISVFGYPGSGKSFGITEVAKSIDDKNIFPINFNVSQFRSTKDLISAFHRVRDISLKEKIPLVFFDEFDCTFEDKPFGWLRYFLAPMQDGEFMDCGVTHPIGKSIFVFAGGVYKSFQEFCENTTASDTQSNSTEKCPDFISRLRGNVNILGPNRISENGIGVDKRDDSYIIRRAVQLRSLIEKNVPNILKDAKDSKGRKIKRAEIDDDLLKTLLIIPRYKHGVRSMEAIIDMSMLQKCRSWGKSSLPPKDQLDLHVDGKHFFTILEEPSIYCTTTINYILNPNTQIMCDRKN